MKSVGISEMKAQATLIEKAHTGYLVDNPEMPASLQCCTYLLALYDIIKPKKILDLGSGISSYCFRLFKKENNLDTEIYSIDSDRYWLDRSIELCRANGLDTDYFELWDDFKNHKGTFDLILVDIDNSTNRYQYFETIFDQFSKPGTIIYLMICINQIF